ncbi:mechanosensitive ion channel family protein [Fulvivirga imtechensis]|nr:mechanosensitive ion channel family protein [Fulvivirga imtechensis]
MSKFVKAASSKLNVDPTKYNFLKNAVSFIVFMIAIIVIFQSIPPLRAYGVTLFASAGILAAIVGFASQSAFSNIISGVFIVIFKPFRVDDIINIGELHAGVVEDITLRHTIIKNFENRRIVIPNSIISEQTITNSTLTEDKVCMFVFMGISYDSDIDLAMKIIQEEAEKHPFQIDNRSQEDVDKGIPEIIVRLIGFGDSSVNLRASVWASNPRDGFAMKCDLHKSIKERFDQEGIEIPFPYRTIVYKEKKTE